MPHSTTSQPTVCVADIALRLADDGLVSFWNTPVLVGVVGSRGQLIYVSRWTGEREINPQKIWEAA